MIYQKKLYKILIKKFINFIQVCPKEMVDKLSNPINLKQIIKEVS